jgi:5-formyltetrahydrofolate cyclo-ligase
MTDRAEEKRLLRAQMRERLAVVTPAERARDGARAAELLLRRADFASAHAVLAFVNLPDEIDTTPIFEQLWKLGKVACVPRVDWPTRTMTAVRIESLDQLRRDTKGLAEPIGHALDTSQVDVVLVPGLAFDRAGRRLGRGAGFYDRWLSSADFHGVAIAVAHGFQLIDHVHAEPHDRPVDVSLLVELTNANG